ncbi:MAG: hypothetical protein OXD32_00780 [Endozoicomonadaceae bacterium]|nr:hypothetical protein [Endozoicomonadaceae bacterium]MCY4330085.1 hypothetical protein [Endozoicomonadaceae bacterium]
MSKWFLIKTHSRQEDRAVINLSRQNFSVYCPYFTRKNSRTEVLFPGYVLLQHTEDISLRTVKSTRGVQGFVRFGETFAVASDELIAKIKRQEKILEGMPLFKEGQLVEFRHGPFAQYRAIYLCDHGEERSVILLKLLNSTRKIQVPTASLCSV